MDNTAIQSTQDTVDKQNECECIAISSKTLERLSELVRSAYGILNSIEIDD